MDYKYSIVLFPIILFGTEEDFLGPYLSMEAFNLLISLRERINY